MQVSEEDVEQKASVTPHKPWKQILLNELFPQLTSGAQQYSVGRSTAILAALYTSHVFSAWGDRMWQFLVTLLLVILYPGSLLLPAVFGLLLALMVALLGTVLGDLVDGCPRMKVVWMSLLVQNGLVCLCAVMLALLFGRDLGFCSDVSLPIFITLVTIVIILGATANLATVTNTIAIEKDWIVVIADKNEDTLACLNANMRRIDLVCKLVAPAVAGVILQFTSPLTTTIVVALWNAISFFAELGLVMLVYHWVPALARKKIRRSDLFEQLDDREGDGEEEEGEEKDEGGEDRDEGEGEGNRGSGVKDDEEEREGLNSDEESELFIENSTTVHSRKKFHKFCVRLFSLFFSLRDGWKIYMHQQIALAGIAMATIYLTVLGFSGVTVAYFITQGLPSAVIGAAQGTGAIFGVSGTIAYPTIRRRLGTVRTGMFGISCQLMMLLLCAIAVVIPGERISNPSDNYYSPHCPSTLNQTCDVQPTSPTTYSTLLFPSPTNLFQSTPTLLPSNILQTTPTPLPSNLIGSGSEEFLYRPIREGPEMSSISPTPTCDTPELDPNKLTWNADRLAPIILILAGVIVARFGLWIFDLAVQQLVQETVDENIRGVVGGVMQAMNSIMDMLHYVMAIVAPRPEHFWILTLISVVVVTLGAVMYAIYLRRVRGHFFHCQQYYQRCHTSNGGRSQTGFHLIDHEQEQTNNNYIVNDNMEEDVTE